MTALNNYSLCEIMTLTCFSDLRTEFGAEGGRRNLSIPRDGERALLRLRRLYNGRTCLPNIEEHY